MNNLPKRKHSAPYGNQNARQHGFYSKVITQTQKHDLKCASSVTGIDQEISLLRVKIKSILEHNPDNNALILQSIITLSHLIRTRYYLRDMDVDTLRGTIENVLTGITSPLGLYNVNNPSRSLEKVTLESQENCLNK